jgi:hypothetical protein
MTEAQSSQIIIATGGSVAPVPAALIGRSRVGGSAIRPCIIAGWGPTTSQLQNRRKNRGHR